MMAIPVDFTATFATKAVIRGVTLRSLMHTGTHLSLQAIGERCLELILDSRGYVVDVADDASDTAFGFPPTDLV
jgi:hypothetical protein